MPDSPATARPRVSVVIPVRNDSRALRTCLAHLADQTVPPDEVIVVDNGSVDDSAELARSWGARVVSEPRVGIPHAAATGYDAATGDLVLRCDADSRVPRTWVEQGLRLLADPAVDAATGCGRFDLPRPVGDALAMAYLGSYYALGHLASARPVLWGSCMAMRRESWHRVRPQVRTDADVHDDLDLALALGPSARIVLDLRWCVVVSARSVRPGRQWHARWRRAWNTLDGQWETTPPWRRWQVRLGR